MTGRRLRFAADGRVDRSASGTLDEARNIVEVSIQPRTFDGGEKVIETVEVNNVRNCFPEKIRKLLKGAGLDLLGLTAFPTLDMPADLGPWNVLGVAQAA